MEQQPVLRTEWRLRMAGVGAVAQGSPALEAVERAVVVVVAARAALPAASTSAGTAPDAGRAITM